MNKKLFSLLTQSELDEYLMYTVIVTGCDDILTTQQLPMNAALKVFNARMNATLSAKNLERVCIKRINSILELCNNDNR